MKYIVTLGYEVEIEAEDRNEAFEKALAAFSEDTHPEMYIAFIDEKEDN